MAQISSELATDFDHALINAHCEFSAKKRCRMLEIEMQVENMDWSMVDVEIMYPLRQQLYVDYIAESCVPDFWFLQMITAN